MYSNNKGRIRFHLDNLPSIFDGKGLNHRRQHFICVFGKRKHLIFTRLQLLESKNAIQTYTHIIKLKCVACLSDIDTVFVSPALSAIPMAMAIYGRDRAEGEKCIRLINYPSNVNSVLSQLKEKFGTSQYAPENDSYHQPYLPAAVLEGATPENGYSPKSPYTVNMRASVNKHQDMQLYDGRVMYIYMMGKGWDTEQRSVEIIQVNEGELFKVFNCPSLYTQCKKIKGTWGGLK